VLDCDQGIEDPEVTEAGDPDRSRAHPIEPFEDFMAREQTAILKLLYALTSDWHAAQDLAQDTFEVAQQAWSRVSNLDRPAAWVKKVAINKQRRWWRRRRLEERLLSQRFLDSQRDQIELPSEHAELWDAVRRLPLHHHEVIVLRYQSDLTELEIADILEIPRGTVKSRLHEARRTLTKWLGDEVEGELP
jgi:RNA polymerase sigma-70 factor (sigma-E family)